jgi:condensin-2 complex subunit H2
LLHNSSHVYSRKVEYLYSLVYAALDNIISSSSNKRSSSKRFDAEIEEFQAFDPHVQFLLLDDVMPTDENNHKINLAETDYDDEEEMPSTTRLSLGGTAATLTVMDKSTAAATVTFLQSGELCILSQGTDANSQGLFYMRGTAQPSPTQSLYSSFGAADPSDINLSTKMDVQPSLADNDGGFANFDDGDDDDGPGFDIAEMNTGEPVNESAPPSTVPKAKPRIKPNPWEMLDPHSASESNGRALRIGTTYRLPPGIDLPPSQCVTGASTRVETHYHPPEPSVEPYCSIATNAYHALLKGEDLPESASANQKLIFGHEFEYLAKAHAKRLAAERRERRLLAQNNPAVVPAEEAEELFGYNDGGFGDYDGDDDDAYAPPFDGPVISPSQVGEFRLGS